MIAIKQAVSTQQPPFCNLAISSLIDAVVLNAACSCQSQGPKSDQQWTWGQAVHVQW